jgi:hypothetical protein
VDFCFSLEKIAKESSMKHGQSIVTQTGSVEFHRIIYDFPNLSDRINKWTNQQLLYAENNNLFFG